MIYQHKNGRFPAGFIMVAVRGETVVGIFPNGDEQLTAWTCDDAHNFKIDGYWVEVK